MKKLFCISLIVLLTGCFGPAKFDASNEVAIKESTQKIVNDLSEDKHEEFKKALMYFTIGGSGGFKSMMSAALAGNSSKTTNEAMLAINLKKIDGLTGEQILEKYKVTWFNGCDTKSLYEVVFLRKRRPSVLPDESTSLNKEQLVQWSKVRQSTGYKSREAYLPGNHYRVSAR